MSRYGATMIKLLEKGLNPVEVATITGHKDTKMLMRYTHLRAEDLPLLRGQTCVVRMSLQLSRPFQGSGMESYWQIQART